MGKAQRKTQMKESDEQAKVLRWLATIGAYALNIHGHEMQESGIHDIIGCMKGLFFSVEMKVPPNKMSKLQEYHMERIERAGGLALEAYTLHDVQGWFLTEGLISEQEI